MIDVMPLKNVNMIIENGHVIAVIIDPDQFAVYLERETSPDAKELKARIEYLTGRVLEEREARALEADRLIIAGTLPVTKNNNNRESVSMDQKE